MIAAVARRRFGDLKTATHVAWAQSLTKLTVNGFTAAPFVFVRPRRDALPDAPLHGARHRRSRKFFVTTSTALIASRPRPLVCSVQQTPDFGHNVSPTATALLPVLCVPGIELTEFSRLPVGIDFAGPPGTGEFEPRSPLL